MATLSYIEAVARYLRAIERRLREDPEAPARAAGRFVAALRPAAIARIRHHWGECPPAALCAPADCEELAVTVVPDAAVRAALGDLDAAWPDIGPTAQAGLERLLDGWAVVSRDGDGLACNLALLSALCVAHGVAGESLWLRQRLPGCPADTARVVASEAARETAALATAGERLGWLATLVPGEGSPMLDRAIALVALAERPDDGARRALAASRLRRVLLDALQGRGTGLRRWCQWMVDVPEADASLETACPLLLADAPRSVLSAVLGGAGGIPGASDALAGLVAGDGERLERAALLRGLELIGAHDVGALVEAAGSAAALPVSGLLAELRPALLGTADEVLVQRPARGSIPWTLLVEAAALPGLEPALVDLLAQDEPWDEFDAPGEGELPGFWCDALVVAGRWDADWHARMAARCPEARLPEPDATAGDVASRYRSPRAGAEQRLDPERSPMSSYSHGLHDGVSEAYGDVWSPSDPFSARRRE